MALYNYLLGKGLAIDWFSGIVYFDYNSIFWRFTTSTCLRDPTIHPFRLFQAVVTLRSRIWGSGNPAVM